MTTGHNYFSALAEEARASRNGRQIAGLRKLRAVLTSAGADKMPRDLARLARHLGVETIHSVPLAMRGRIAIDHGRLAIELNEDDPPSLQKVTLAHELAHLILEADRARRAVVAGRATTPYDEQEYAAVEQVCDLMAAELVLPERWLLEQLDLEHPSLADAQVVADTSGSSVGFVARRAIETGIWRAYCVGWAVAADYTTPLWSVPPRSDVFASVNRRPTRDAGLIRLAAESGGLERGRLALVDDAEVGADNEAQALVDEDRTVVTLLPQSDA